MESPQTQACVRRANYLTHSLSMRVESWVPQNAPDEACRLVFRNGQQHAAISRVAVRGLIEPVITREEREPSESPKKRNDFSIAHSRMAKLVTNLLYAYPPASQKAALAVGKVFVENDHEPVMRVGSGRVTSASRARRTASAIASIETAPLHSSTIVSHAMPRATCPRTSATRIRVPRNVGLPPQMPESATTYRPSASALGVRERPAACDRFVRLACMWVLSAQRIISVRNEFFEAAEWRDAVIGSPCSTLSTATAMPRCPEDLSGELLAPAAAELVRRLAAEAAELVLELAREGAHLSCSLFADLLGDLPDVVHRPFSSLVPSS
jgi:hypothetical protein